MDSVAERTPVAVGLNVTLTVQLAPAAKVVPQVPPPMPAGRTNTPAVVGMIGATVMLDPKSTPLYSSHTCNSYAVLCVNIYWDANSPGCVIGWVGTSPV